MKLFVLSDLWPPFPGGAERFIFNVADQLRQRGADVHVLTSYFKFAEGWAGTYQPAKVLEFERDGMRIHFYPIGVRSQGEQAHVEGWRVIERLIGELRPDIVLTHHVFAREFDEELSEVEHVVQVVHNGPRLPWAALAVYNSDWTRERAGAKPHDVTIIPPAFEEVAALSHESALGFVKPIEHKGVDFIYRLVEAMPERQFVILRGEWQTLEDIRPRANITFMDPVMDVRDFYGRCRVMLMPSLSEDAGTIPQEAAVNGLPCISSAVMGLNETNAAGIRLKVGVAEMWTWVEEIRKLDDPAYYATVADRQREGLAAFRWTEKFDALSERMKEWLP
jgi:glycosyltransferase involved in cell wall biosynthesis